MFSARFSPERRKTPPGEPRAITSRKALRPGDWLRVAIGGALLAVVVGVLIFVVPNLTPSQLERPASNAGEPEKPRVDAETHRRAAILFTEPNRCWENAFDNATGYVSYKGEVDCDARFADPRSGDEKRAERMRDVMQGFRR